MRPLSARNPRISRLSKLVKRRSERATQRVLVVEGPTLIATALEHEAKVREIYVDEAHQNNPGVEAVLAKLGADVDQWLLEPGVLDRVGDVATSQGVLAVVEYEPATLEIAAAIADRESDSRFVLMTDGLQIPGNVGTLIRAAAGAGASAVVVANGADPTSPKVVRASAGAWFGLDVIGSTDPVGVLEDLKSRGFRVATAVAHGGCAYDSADLSGPLVLVVGSEAHGPSREVQDLSDLLVTIPLAGPVESLNVAMAGTLLCFEVLRQARARS